MKRKVEVAVGSLQEVARGFVAAWRRAESGQADRVRELVSFEDMETLLTVLTPTRWRLLRALRSGGPMSVRALSRTVARDYKNVHTDVRELERAGLLARDGAGLVSVPWDVVRAELRLAAA